MKKKLGFVINAPLKYSETFLLEEFKLLENDFEILIFEGYNTIRPVDGYRRIRSLPNSIKTFTALLHVAKSLLRLLAFRPKVLIKFMVYERDTGTNLVRIMKRIWFNAHLLSAQADHLHFCFADVAIQKELAAKALGIKMSVSLRGSDVLVYGARHPHCYSRLWKYASKVHAVSRWVFENALRQGMPYSTDHCIIHDAVDPDRIPFNHFDIHKPVRIVNVGRLVPEKDHLFSLEVIRRLIYDNTDIRYTIIGDGFIKPVILSRIRELGLEEYVEVKGKLPHQQLLGLLSSFDLYIHCSASEGLGVSLLEAQAAGLLTIALESGSTGENIEDSRSGWIVRERNIELMASQISEVIKLSSQERIQVKDYARTRIEKNFDIRQLYPVWKRFFETQLYTS